jgi:hypothetical protein
MFVGSINNTLFQFHIEIFETFSLKFFISDISLSYF